MTTSVRPLDAPRESPIDSPPPLNHSLNRIVNCFIDCPMNRMCRYKAIQALELRNEQPVERPGEPPPEAPGEGEHASPGDQPREPPPWVARRIIRHRRGSLNRHMLSKLPANRALPREVPGEAPVESPLQLIGHTELRVALPIE